MTRSSAARAGSRHRVPSRRGRQEGAGEVVTVAQLLSRNQGQLFGERPLWCRLAWYRPRYAPPPRRITVIPRPRTPQDQRLRC
ncbi:MAG: hypothetical protein JO115_19255 [Pseudonocardiales bacterium]|nr:hypothetical protein [Pseudonocardiales bacterium]